MRMLSEADAVRLQSVERLLIKGIDNRNVRQANALRIVRIINKKIAKK